MELTPIQTKLLQQLQKGIPVTSDPYGEIADSIGCDKVDLLNHCIYLKDKHLIKRMGVIVNHPMLGYKHNGMVVWDIPDKDIDTIGYKLACFPFVGLCYQRPRQLPAWPYNLFCMIHGKSRNKVREQVQLIINQCALESIPHEILFSTRQFKQRGGRYA